MLVYIKLHEKSCCYMFIIYLKNASQKVKTDDIFSACPICILLLCYNFALVLHNYCTCYNLINNLTRLDHNVGATLPALGKECVDSLTSLANLYKGDAGDGTYGLSSLFEKTRISNHLWMSQQKQRDLLDSLRLRMLVRFGV